jgi:hypothetical protein
MVLKSYITELISELQTNNSHIYQNMDLVLDAGAFNGGFQLGALLYLKELERNNITKINRVSGASIGSVLALSYLIDRLDLISIFSKNIMDYYKCNFNLFIINSVLDTFLSNMNKHDYKKLKDRLYISYFDYTTKTHITIHRFKNNKDVIEQIKKSCHLPFISTKNECYSNGVDGAYPYIFKGDKPSLFLKLISIEQMKTMMITKNETNIYNRVIDGIIDINNFFNKKKSIMCSFINKWSFIDFMIIRMREIIWILYLYTIEYMVILYNKLPTNVINSNIFKNIKSVLQNVYFDFMQSTIC